MPAIGTRPSPASQLGMAGEGLAQWIGMLHHGGWFKILPQGKGRHANGLPFCRKNFQPAKFNFGTSYIGSPSMGLWIRSQPFLVIWVYISVVLVLS